MAQQQGLPACDPSAAVTAGQGDPPAFAIASDPRTTVAAILHAESGACVIRSVLAENYYRREAARIFHSGSGSGSEVVCTEKWS